VTSRSVHLEDGRTTMTSDERYVPGVDDVRDDGADLTDAEKIEADGLQVQDTDVVGDADRIDERDI